MSQSTSCRGTFELHLVGRVLGLRRYRERAGVSCETEGKD